MHNVRIKVLDENLVVIQQVHLLHHGCLLHGTLEAPAHGCDADGLEGGGGGAGQSDLQL